MATDNIVLVAFAIEDGGCRDFLHGHARKAKSLRLRRNACQRDHRNWKTNCRAGNRRCDGASAPIPKHIRKQQASAGKLSAPTRRISLYPDTDQRRLIDGTNPPNGARVNVRTWATSSISLSNRSG